jgi:hypothetical protein
VTGLPEGSTFGDAIALAQARQAIKGETGAAREIREALLQFRTEAEIRVRV